MTAHLARCRDDLAHTPLLAVYGSLRRCGPAHARFLNAPRARFRAADRVSGSLYDLGAYPAYLTEPAGPVAVELYEIGSPELLRALDRFEDYTPEAPSRSVYRRALVMPAAAGREAWIYVYLKPVRAGARIASGDWCAHAGRRARISPGT